MTDLDRRVAELRKSDGWTIDLMGNARDATGFWMTPATDLAQAYQLWDEARPEGEVLCVQQYSDSTWSARTLSGVMAGSGPTYIPFAKLPRAITQTWVKAKEQAMEQEGKR